MDRKDGLRDKLDTLDEEELKDIIELQLEEIKALKADQILFSSPYNIKVSFDRKKNKPKPFDK
tara:strand:- start:147 stop:335 length:189 start_codon:yes stop_codon:yes gene_type:complete